MKKVYVVSKTHMDLGFTDYAENIRQTYINTYIPNAILLAEQMNTKERKKFVWTTGSWIIKNALEKSNPEQKENLLRALKNGDVVPHALPFTTHTELLDADTIEYGLKIVDELDLIRGKKTVSAKMTDVPGHTRGLVSHLSKHGIKLLHIGVNEASALCDVPPCFLWKNGDDEIVVIYSGAYGGAFSCDFTDEILYFDHTLDNRGAPSPEKIQEKLDLIQAEYPSYEVEAGTMDDIAHVLWEKRSFLPVVTSELGDTWIHGAATDPYKSSALRVLMSLKAKWLEDKTMVNESEEYNNFSDNLLCLAEHTCGMDTKVYFADYENYLKRDFQNARKRDKVVLNYPLRDYPQNLIVYESRQNGNYREGRYSVIEKSWSEQRDYINSALSQLSDDHKEEAKNELEKLIPKNPCEIENNFDLNETVACGKWQVKINEFGGIEKLVCGDDEVIRENKQPVISYRSFDETDYDFWLTHYTRDYSETISWCVGDFARPLLKYAKGKYPSGRFSYSCVSKQKKEYEDKTEIIVDLKCDERLSIDLGAPRIIQIKYILSQNGLSADVSWFNKDANRLTEAMYLHMMPSKGEFKLVKLEEEVDYKDVVSMGGRNLHAVQKSVLYKNNRKYYFKNLHSPLISIGKGKILEFDNKIEDIEKDGITYVLHNNVWGTNFPQWYEDNAYFRFKIGEEN